MSADNDSVEVLLLEQRVKTLETIALKTEPMLTQILSAIKSLELMLQHAAENHRGLSERVADHEVRIRASEAKHIDTTDHETRLRKLENDSAQTWYLKPMSYTAFIGAIGAIAAAVWKSVGH